jgi:cytoskeletal protein CcmA (bactofilin family)
VPAHARGRDGFHAPPRCLTIARVSWFKKSQPDPAPEPLPPAVSAAPQASLHTAAPAPAARPVTAPRAAAAPADEGPTVITEDTTIRGSVTSASSLLICGVIEGSVHCGGDVELLGEGSIRGDVVGIDVTVHKGAHVKGNVSGRDVEIGGKVEGEVAASGRLTIGGSGNVVGDITVRALAVADGGVLLGKCKMGDGGARSSGPR